jgi:2-methylisocitrate lyase-like PEP mutase family enzyme
MHADELRRLLDTGQTVVAVEAYSLLTARVVEKAGFSVAYTGGSALGGMHYGVPDHGLVAIEELVDQAGRMARGIDIPLIADADQAGETALNVRRAVMSFIDAGVSGIHIEDTVNPKHLYDGDYLQPVSEMCCRLEAAVDARTDPDFVVIARSDEMFNDGSLEEAVSRGKAYAEAGADAFMCLLASPNRREVPTAEYRQLIDAVPIPVVDINVPVGRAEELGLGLDIFTGPSVFAAAARHRELITPILESGDWSSLRAAGLTQDEYKSLVRDNEWLRVAKAWQSAVGTALRE